MSSFRELGDEFAGDEANEEWDAAWEAYTRGAETGTVTASGPLRAALRLPTCRVELRGDIDDVLVALLVDLHDEQEALADALGVEVPARLVTFTVHTEDAGAAPTADRVAWHLDQNGLGTVDEGEGSDALRSALLTRIIQASTDADAAHLHIDAACVEIDGLGVVLCGGSHARRNELLDALLAGGGALLTAEDLVVQPGTRAVRGTAMPLIHSAGSFVPASTVAPLVAHSSADAIVFLDESAPGGVDPASVTGDEAPAEADRSGELRRVDSAPAVLRLLHAQRGPSPSVGTALELLGLLVAGATCVDGGPSDPGAWVAAIRSVQPPERRELVARFQWSSGRAVTRAQQGSRRSRRGAVTTHKVRRMVRFDRAAIVDDGADAHGRLISAAAADELEAEASATLGARPVPEAFGLPNCPTGATARRLWEGLSVLEAAGDTAGETDASATAPGGTVAGEQAPARPRAVGVADRRSDLPTGVAAELISRDLLAADAAQRTRIVNRHVAAREETEVATAALLDLLDAADGAEVVPVVVGALALAFDGPLPEHFTDVDRLDLLVRKEHLDDLVERLERRGYVADARTVSGSFLTTTSDVRLRNPRWPSILIDLHRTLAAGPFGELVDPEEFHRRAVPFRVDGRWARALHPEHRFVHECVRADRGETGASTAELRDVVLSAPRSESLMAETMECSARWGATTSVLAVARTIDARLPGLPSWLVERATRYERTSSRRRRRAGRT